MVNQFEQKKPVVIASRKSDLARLQSLTVGASLKKASPDMQIDYRFSASLGDINLDQPLWKMPEKGVFTQDFYEDLVGGEVDMVVHSWKDLPVEPRPHTEIVATLKRGDVRDLLLVRKDSWETICKKRFITVLSSSPRRVYNLEYFLPEILPTEIDHCEFKDVRGNIHTRISKLLNGEGDGLIVAKAAIDRLLSVDCLKGNVPDNEFETLTKAKAVLETQLNRCLWMALPFSVNPTAAAQGAIAIEVRKTEFVPAEEKERHHVMIDALKKINRKMSFNAVRFEREILSIYGGGCHQKIGVNVIQCCKGQISYLKGVTEEGKVLDEIILYDHKEKKQWQITRVGSELVWPNLEEVYSECKHKDLYIKNTIGDGEKVNWVSTVEEWKEYASRGVWINGTSDSLSHCTSKNMSTLVDVYHQEDLQNKAI